MSAICPHICYSRKENNIYRVPSIRQVSWIPPMKAILECCLKSGTQAKPGGACSQGIFKIQRWRKRIRVPSEAQRRKRQGWNENEWQSWCWGLWRTLQQHMGLVLRESELSLWRKMFWYAGLSRALKPALSGTEATLIRCACLLTVCSFAGRLQAAICLFVCLYLVPGFLVYNFSSFLNLLPTLSCHFFLLSMCLLLLAALISHSALSHPSRAGNPDNESRMFMLS